MLEITIKVEESEFIQRLNELLRGFEPFDKAYAKRQDLVMTKNN